MSKSEALWSIAHHSKGAPICIFDRELDARLFGQKELLKEYEIALAHSGSSLKVYTLPERLTQFQNHQHDPFIAFVLDHGAADIQAIEKGSGMPDCIWGTEQSFEMRSNKDREMGYLYPASENRHRELGTMFVNLPRLYGCDGPAIRL